MHPHAKGRSNCSGNRPYQYPRGGALIRGFLLNELLDTRLLRLETVQLVRKVSNVVIDLVQLARQHGQICRDRCMKHNLICRPVSDAMVLSPPLIITKDEIDELARRLERCLDETAQAIGQA